MKKQLHVIDYLLDCGELSQKKMKNKKKKPFLIFIIKMMLLFYHLTKIVLLVVLKQHLTFNYNHTHLSMLSGQILRNKMIFLNCGFFSRLLWLFLEAAFQENGIILQTIIPQSSDCFCIALKS